jgi:acyl carrier protein
MEITDQRIEYLLEKCQDLSKLSHQSLSTTLNEVLGLEYNPNKTWGDMGLDDDLDMVEFAMALEKKLDIIISDDVIEEVFGRESYPIDFISIIRHKKLEKIISFLY